MLEMWLFSNCIPIIMIYSSYCLIEIGNLIGIKIHADFTLSGKSEIPVS